MGEGRSAWPAVECSKSEAAAAGGEREGHAWIICSGDLGVGGVLRFAPSGGGGGGGCLVWKLWSM